MGNQTKWVYHNKIEIVSARIRGVLAVLFYIFSVQTADITGGIENQGVIIQKGIAAASPELDRILPTGTASARASLNCATNRIKETTSISVDRTRDCGYCDSLHFSRCILALDVSQQRALQFARLPWRRRLTHFWALTSSQLF
eukprot:scaffold320336_cov19-Prasinocladus_malaysianus.AAC.1